MPEFKLPAIGEGVVEGEIVRWLKQPGERVAANEGLVEVMTDKATVEIPSPQDAIVERHVVAEGAVAEVGEGVADYAPGDPVVGLMDSGHGMIIHSDTCSRLPEDDEARTRLTHLKWAKDITDEFSVELRVEMERQRGVIAEIASAVAMADGNIERINVEEQNARFGVVSLVVHVNGRRHLARVMRRVKNIRAVTHIHRVRH